MNCSPSATASGATPAVRPVATTRPASAVFLRLIRVLPDCRTGQPCMPRPVVLNLSTPKRRPPTCWFAAVSIWKRPAAQLFLADLPEAGEPVRLDDQEEDDQRAKDHELHVG